MSWSMTAARPCACVARWSAYSARNGVSAASMPALRRRIERDVMTGKVLIVTGGSRGIGAATCRLAGRQGYAVAVNYQRDAAAAKAVVADIEREGGKAIAVQADVAREAEVEQLFAETDTRLGPVTHLVNNAGIVGRANRLDAVDAATLESVFALN